MPPKAIHTKALKAMKNFGYSEKIVRPILKELLKLYENNWLLIEEDNYRVLVDAILDSEEQKTWSNELECLNTWSEDETEDDEPLSKRSKLSIQKNKSSPSYHASNPNGSNKVENQSRGKRKMAESNYEKHQDKDIELRAPYVAKFCHGKGKTSGSPQSLIVMEQEKETQLISDDDSDQNPLVPLVHLEKSGDECDKRMISYERDPTRLLLQGNSHRNYSNAKENRSTFNGVTDMDAENTPPYLLPKDAYSIGNSSVLEGHHSESTNYKQSENENDAQDSLKLDIASSSRGEVKICLTVNSSLRSDFHVPRLEDVLKQMEEQCLKSYRISQTGFSMLRIMKEVCECFSAGGIASPQTEDIRPANAVSSLGISSDSDSETGPPEGTDKQLVLYNESNISNDPARIQNHFEASLQIPRFVGSVQLDFSCCRISLNLNINSSSEMGRSIMEMSSSVASSSRMMIIQKQRSYHYIEDITKGQEAHEISLINEINEDGGPTFHYISKNVTYQNADMRFLLARLSEENCCSGCSGDCLSRQIACNCAGETGGKFAYSPEGLLSEKFLDNFISINHSVLHRNLFYCQDCPLERSNAKNLPGKCKGHVVRSFIKECWYKCGCSMKCANRVVQQGIKAKLQVFMTHVRKGWGLRTLEDVPKGAFICEYVGEVITARELFERSMQNTSVEHIHPVPLDAYWSFEGLLKDEKALCVDPTVYANVSRFINHRCFDANLVEVPVKVETPDHHYYHLAFFTTRKVHAFEELTWDYGIDFDDSQSAKAFKCHCGSKFCRDRKTVRSK